MESDFDRLPRLKRQAVLAAGWSRFGASGYRKTSMADVARAAEVSKASLFHYFGTKLGLYRRLFSESVEILLAAVVEGNDDFFDSIALGTAVKLRLMRENPGMYDFLLGVVTEADQDAVAQLRQINTEGIRQGMAKLFAHVDWSRFRPEFDQATIMSLASWVTEGCIKQNAHRGADVIVAEEARYLGLLKEALYNEEYR